MKPGYMKPVPRVTINATPVPVTLSEDTGDALVLDDLSIDWGVRELFGETEPSRLKITIFDHTGAWFIPARLPGADIRIWVEWHTDTTETNPTEKLVIFRGQITDAPATPVNLGDEHANRHGWRITISAIDRLGQLGNTMINAGKNPTDIGWTIDQLIKLIEDQSGNFVKIVPPRRTFLWQNKDFTNDSALTIVQDMYFGAFESAAYSPGPDYIEGFDLRFESKNTGLRLEKTSSGYKVGMPGTRPGWTRNSTLIVSARDFESDGVLELDLSQAITRVNVKEISVAGEEKTVSTEISTPNSYTLGTRTLFRETKGIDRAHNIAQEIKKVYELIGWLPRPAEITQKITVFETPRDKSLWPSTYLTEWLSPTPNINILTINGSVHLNTDPDWISAFSVRSGLIRWKDQQWEITSRLTPEPVDLDKVKPFTFLTLFHDSTGEGHRLKPDSFDTSVSLGDLRAVDHIASAS